jgi:(2R)-3-sulfolactate dehydrogenase (NADP+)
MPVIPFEPLVVLASDYLVRAGSGEEMARATARGLVVAEAQGIPSHGLSRLSQYAAHLRHGRVDGQACPVLRAERPAALLVDAADGFAFPACEMAVAGSIVRARQYGVTWAGVFNSHHAGVLSYHLHEVGAAGLIGLAFSNSPAAMPAWGGQRPLFGTNPIAAIFPRRQDLPLIIDLSLSAVARGKLMVAAREGRSIPLGWAVDAEGQPTTDPQRGLEGMMLPTGGVKGAMLALVVELLCCALTGASYGFEADSFFSPTGNRPRIGQAFLVIDPDALGGADLFNQRLETLITAMLADEGVRLPGSHRLALLLQAIEQGVSVSDSTLAELAQ